MSSDIYRVGVLSVVKHDYLPNGLKLHPRLQIVVVADDADQPEWVHERNEKYAHENGVPYVQDVEKAIADYNVQIAAISSQAERHCDLSVRAAEAGCHIVQDKPMSTRVSECDRVVEAVERKGVKFLMWNRSFLPAVIEAREAIREGIVGEPYAFHADFYFSKDVGPLKGSRKPGDPKTNWLEFLIAAHVDGSDGGVGVEPLGELGIEGCYPLAYIASMSDLKVERVYAETTAHFHQLYDDNDVEDLATVTLEMEKGVVGSISIGRIGAASHPDIGEIKMHILGSKGGFVVSEARPEVGVYYRDQPPKEFKNHRLNAIENDYLLANDIVQAIDNDADTFLNVRTSRAITATIQAALESGRTGQSVKVS